MCNAVILLNIITLSTVYTVSTESKVLLQLKGPSGLSMRSVKNHSMFCIKPVQPVFTTYY